MINEVGRDAIADAMMAAADIAENAPTASQTAAFGMPGFNDPVTGLPSDMSMVSTDFAPTGPPAGSSGNLFSTQEEGASVHSAGSNMFGAPSSPNEPDFGKSGGLFEGKSFDMFGNVTDPIGDMFGAQPGTPTAPSFNSTPGVPADPGDPFGNSDTIASNAFGAGFAAGSMAAMSGEGVGQGEGAGQGDTSGSGSSSSSSGGDPGGSPGGVG